jgi:hypothetical protein
VTKKISRVAVGSRKQRLSVKNPEAERPSDCDILLTAIDGERQRIVRARAVVQTAAKLLHELFVPEKGEPDIGFVLDVVCDLLETSLAGLDRVTLKNL